MSGRSSSLVLGQGMVSGFGLGAPTAAGDPARLATRDGPGLPFGERGEVSRSFTRPGPSVSLPDPAAKEWFVLGIGRPPFADGAGEWVRDGIFANFEPAFLILSFLRAAVDSLPLASERFGDPGRLRF